MRRWCMLLMLSVLTAGIYGCASVDIYSSPELKKANRTGLKFYHSKPYLLVTRTGAKDNPITVQIVYLQDTASPQYARYRPGIGASSLNLELTNSILAKFGQTGDTKLPETLTAVGSLLGSAAGAFKTFVEGKNLEDQASLDFAKSKAASDSLKRISEALGNARIEAENEKLTLTPAQKDRINTTIDTINSAAAKLEDPKGTGEEKLKEVIATLDALIKDWDQLKISAAAGDIAGTRYDSVIERLKGDVNQVIESLKGGITASPTPATFELYEIRQKDGKTDLVRVMEMTGNQP